MLIKKQVDSETINGVTMGNGQMSFAGQSFNVYSYFVDGVLIDTGPKTMHKQFEPFFKQHDIEQVVLTHHHEDHTGGAALLQNKRNIPIYQSDELIDDCTKQANYPLYRKLVCGNRPPFFATPLAKTFESNNATWKVIPTPGHAVDHVVFLNRDTGQLFTGDLYVQEKTKVALKDESIPMIIDSIKRVLTYDFDEVFCSHAGLLADGREALKNKLDYLENLQGEILKLYYEGLSPVEIRKKLLYNNYPVVRFSFGDFDALNIVTSILQEHTEMGSLK